VEAQKVVEHPYRHGQTNTAKKQFGDQLKFDINEYSQRQGHGLLEVF